MWPPNLAVRPLPSPYWLFHKQRPSTELGCERILLVIQLLISEITSSVTPVKTGIVLVTKKPFTLFTNM